MICKTKIDDSFPNGFPIRCNHSPFINKEVSKAIMR